MEKKLFLQTKEVTKQFGEVTAVDHVNMEIYLGEIRGLIGENGSGKSTISSMISGIHSVTSGKMFLEKKPYKPASPADASTEHISMIVQETGTIDLLTVAENIFLGGDEAAVGKAYAKALNASSITNVSGVSFPPFAFKEAPAIYNAFKTDVTASGQKKGNVNIVNGVASYPVFSDAASLADFETYALGRGKDGMAKGPATADEIKKVLLCQNSKATLADLNKLTSRSVDEIKAIRK